jgi:hypothetical protein
MRCARETLMLFTNIANASTLSELRNRASAIASERGFYICGTRERQTIHLDGEFDNIMLIQNFPHGNAEANRRVNSSVYDFTIYRAIEIPTDDPGVIETWYLVGALNGPCGWTQDVTLTLGT